jgi:heavy metal sensor kinase
LVKKISSNFPLRVRLTAWYVLLLACTLTVFSGYLYVQLKRSLIKQLDATLEVTASQTINNLIEKQGHPAFKKSTSSHEIITRLAHNGFALRLISPEGKLWDGVGNYHAIPLYTVQKLGYINLKTKTTRWRVYSYPLPWLQNKEEGWLQVIQSLNPVTETSEHLLFLMLLSVIPVLILTALGGLFLAHRALSPINRIIEITEAIRPEDFTKRIAYEGIQDEVGRLATTIDIMLERIEKAFEHEKQFSVDAAHELRTPLTIMKGKIEVTLNRNRTTEEYQITLHTLEEEVNRLIRLTNSLLFLTNLDQQTELTSDFSAFNLTNLLEVLLEEILPLAENRQIVIKSNLKENLIIFGNSDYLTNLFLNLLDNALKYTPENGEIEIITRILATHCEIAISNTGVEIKPEELVYLFERFYRVKEMRSLHRGGAGLGLAIATKIARLHGGLIRVESEKNKLTTFTVELPLNSEK